MRSCGRGRVLRSVASVVDHHSTHAALASHIGSLVLLFEERLQRRLRMRVIRALTLSGGRVRWVRQHRAESWARARRAQVQSLALAHACREALALDIQHPLEDL